MSEDPYRLLDVPRDASPDQVRRAYEIQINRAHRDGALKLATELSAAFDTLSQPHRRELYDRHGLMSVRERSPGAAPPPTPWRIAKHEPRVVPAGRRRRSWRMPTMAVFTLGLAGGIGLAAWTMQRHEAVTTPPADRYHSVLCNATRLGAGYVYSEVSTAVPRCRNGARPQVLGR